MTAIARAAEMPKARIGEFLLVGGATPLLFLLSWLLRRALPMSEAELAVGFTFFWAAHVINDPHFAVTYLLFYRDAQWKRPRWIAAGAIAPAMLAAWAIFGLATKSPHVLGLLIQLMFLLVGWHYVKQGFGVMTVLAARRGVRFEPRERVAILAHCYAGWAYAWASPFDPGRELEEKGVVYTSIAHPRGLEQITFAIFVITIVPLVVVIWKKRHRPIWTPLVALLVSIWSWSIWSSVDPLVRYMIPALHSIQYLYMVWLLRRGETREREGPPFFESWRSKLGLFALATLALGWFLFHGAPTVLDDMLVPKKSRFTDLGATPYFAALYAFVNIHHYVMDAVMWRRDNPRMKHLTASSG